MKIGSVCPSVCVPRCFLAPCDTVSTQSVIAATFYHPVTSVNTGDAHQQAGRQASSAWRHTVWLPTVVSVCAALLRLTPQATIVRSTIVACGF